MPKNLRRPDLSTRERSKSGSSHRAFRRLALLAGLLPATLFLSSQVHASSVFDAKGPRAQSIATFLWILIGIATIVVIGVFLFLLIGSIRRQPATGTRSPGGSAKPVVIVGAIIPAIVLVVVLVCGYTLRTLAHLAEPDTAVAATINVVGHQWWWDVHYQEDGIATANEIHIPVGVPVRVNLTSDGVIHSFWIPQLSDKVDMIPGHTNTVWIQADEPGEYRGECAEFCGDDHAWMAFVVVAESPDTYAAWVTSQQQSAQFSADAVVP